MEFRLKDYLSPLNILQFRRQMATQPYWTADRQAAWSVEKRLALIKHAYESVPYYKQLFESLGMNPADVAEPEQWRTIPELTKDVVRAQPESLVSESRGNGRVWASTSGSTGEQMRVLLDSNINAAAFALFWRAWNSGGFWRIGQRHAVLKAPLIDTVWRINHRIRAIEIPAIRVAPENVPEIKRALERYKPRFIRCLPSALYLLCKLLREMNLSLQLPMVITGSEALEDFQRREFEEFLGARVFNHYTHWERCASALECEAGRIHVQEDYGHHEILRPDGTPTEPGEIGEIVVTGLHHQAMPFIRYRTGDLANWTTGQCDCGQVFPTIDRVVGRVGDYVVGKSGERIASLSIEAILDEEEGVRCIQYIQNRPGVLELSVVVNDDFDMETGLKYLAEKAENAIGPSVSVIPRICSMDDIQRSPAGKIRYFINRIPQ
jgi:phenylacetate-CoA ligase